MAQQQAQLAREILAALERTAPDRGVDVVSVELAGPSGRPTVRVRIEPLDGSPADMGEVCAHTPWVSQVIEDLDPFPEAYDLEVSSPGLDRPLRRAQDFARFAGDRAEVSLVEKVDGRSRATGTILSVEGEVVALDLDGTPWSFSLAQLKSARLKPDYAKIFARAKEDDSVGTLVVGDEDSDEA